MPLLETGEVPVPSLADKDTQSDIRSREYGLWRQSILYSLTSSQGGGGSQFPHFYDINYLRIKGLIKYKFFSKKLSIKRIY